MTELTEEDRTQLATADRLRRMSELHAYSRSLLGFSALPPRKRLRNLIQGFGYQDQRDVAPQAVYESDPQVDYQVISQKAPQGVPQGQGGRRMGFGILQGLADNIRGGAQARQTQASPEDLEAEEERKRQLLEASARRRALAEETAEKIRKAEALEKAKRGISLVDI